MSGYKRVNFYDLCRLCATLQQSEKTHIFLGNGKKQELQKKINNGLSLKVEEADNLPKIICSKCLKNLEIITTFRDECAHSEQMLSSYFNNFRYTEDFKRSGKVYIKDTPPKVFVQEHPICNEPPRNDVPPTKNTPFTSQITSQITPNIVKNITVHNKMELEPKNEPHQFYTGQIVATVIQQNTTAKTPQKDIRYNLNQTGATNLGPIKMHVVKNDNLNSFVVNPSGDIINCTNLDFKPLLTHNKTTKPPFGGKKLKIPDSENIIKIDLTENTNEYDSAPVKYPKLKVPPSQAEGMIFEVPVHQNFVAFAPQGEQMYANLINSSNVQQNESSTVNLTALSYDNFSSQKTVKKQIVEPPTDPLAPPKEPHVKTHVCEMCQKSFKRREHLYQHMKLHTGFRPYVCENCHKCFMRKEHLLRHMTSHSGLKNYICNVCEKSFSRNDNLLKHKKLHEKQNSFQCEYCSKQFVMKHYYVAHKQTHEGQLKVEGGQQGKNWGGMIST